VTEKTYQDATPDDLPEEFETGGFRAALRPRRDDRRTPELIGVDMGSEDGDVTVYHHPQPQARADRRDVRAADVIADARAARRRAEDVLDRVHASQSGASPRDPSRRGQTSTPRRAVGTDIQNALGEVHRAVADMRAEHDLHERDTRRGRPDPVRAERIRRTDDAIDAAERRERRLVRDDTQARATDDLRRTVDMQARQIRALRTGTFGGAAEETDARGRRISAQARSYIRDFNAYLRHADEGGVRRTMAALTTREDTGGGFFIPEEWDRTMSRLMLDSSVMRQIATVRTISGPLLKKPKILNGGTARWVGETTAPTETASSSIAELEFTVMTMEAFPLITQELLEDSGTDLEAWLAEDVQEQFTTLENPAFITGTGSKQPRGLLSYSFVANATYEAAPATYWGKFGYLATGVSGDWAASSPADIFYDMENALRPGYRANASWLVNRSLVPTIRKFKDSTGNYLWEKSLTAGKPSMLLTYPLHEDDYMPTLAANSYSLGFGDWAKTYLILDRLGSTVLRDPYTQKPYICFYTRKRVGGAVQEFQSAKFLKFGTS
jgi:HK97 family phage major capsid protein